MRQRTKRLLAVLLAMVLVLTGIPIQTQAAEKVAVTVKTQKDLEKALENKNVKKITINADKEKTFTIKKGNYSGKTIVVNGAKLTVKNNGKVNSVLIKDAKKYVENASGNTIKVTDKQLTLKVGKKAEVKKITLSKTGAKDKLVIEGTVKKVTVEKKTSLTIADNGVLTTVNVKEPSKLFLTGSTVKTVTVNTGVNAEGSILKTRVPVLVGAKAPISVTLREGAEASVLKAKTTEAVIALINETKLSVDIEKADGTSVTVEAGKDGSTESKENEAPENTNPSEELANNTGSSSSSGSTYRVSAATRLSREIANGGTNGVVTVSENITGNVTATYNGTAPLTIKFGSYTLTGNLSITAPNAETIIFEDAGEGVEGAEITGTLTVNAPKAHIENNVTAETIVILGVADSTFLQKDSAGKIKMQGKGKLHIPDTLVNKPSVFIETTQKVILDGAIDFVKVAADHAELEVAENATVSNVVTEEEVTNLNIAGEGTVEKVDTTEKKVSAQLTIKFGDSLTVEIIIAVSKDGIEIEAKVEPKVVTVSSIALNTESVKTEYYVGEELDLTGLIATVTYSEGEPETVQITRGMVSGFDNQKTGEQTLTVTYGGKTAVFTVTVKEDAVSKLQLQLNAAKAGTTVVLKEEITIPANRALVIPKGVTLEAAGAGKIHIELAGCINVYGTLKGEEDTAILFTEEYRYDDIVFPLLLKSGATWVNGSATFKSTGDGLSLYNGEEDYWIIRNTLEIITSDGSFDLDKYTFELDDRYGIPRLVVNGKTYESDDAILSVTALGRLQLKLKAAEAQATVTTEEPVTVPNGKFLSVPKDVTLQVSETNPLTVELGGSIVIFGTLEGEEGKNILFSEEGATDSFPIVMKNNATWKNGGITYENTDNNDGFPSVYDSACRTWLLRSTLKVTAEDAEGYIKTYKFYFNAEEKAVLVVNSTTYATQDALDKTLYTPLEYYQRKLRNTASGSAITLKEELTIPEGEYLEIRAGVTLNVEGEGKLIIERGGLIKVHGTLNGVEGTNIVFDGSMDGYSNSICLTSTADWNGTWINGTVTYRCEGETDNSFSNYDGLYEFWTFVGNTLNITGDGYVYDEDKFHIEDGGCVKVNGQIYTANE